MTERQASYTPSAPYIRPDHIHIQRWQTGYTCCLMTDKRTYRLFGEDLEGLWKQITEITGVIQPVIEVDANKPCDFCVDEDAVIYPFCPRCGRNVHSA